MMSFRENGNRYFLKIKDRRQQWFFIRYMHRHEVFQNDVFDANDITACQHQMMEAIRRLHPNDNHEQDAFVQRMKKAFETELLSDEDLKWVKTDEKACYFVWGVIRMADERYLGFQEQYGSHSRLYHQMQLPQTTANTIERYNAIRQFFDYLETDIEHCRRVLQNIKDCWGDVLNQNLTAHIWLRKEVDLDYEWAWNYIKDHDFGATFSSPVTGLNPVDDKEKRLAVYTVWGLWVWSGAINSDMELLMLNMKKAWSQIKHRRKYAEKNMVQFSAVIHEGTKEKLDELAQYHGLKINEYLAKLIEDEHSRMSKNC